MRIKIYDGIQLMKTKEGKPRVFRSKKTAYDFLEMKGRTKDIGTKIKLVTYFNP